MGRTDGRTDWQTDGQGGDYMLPRNFSGSIKRWAFGGSCNKRLTLRVPFYMMFGLTKGRNDVRSSHTPFEPNRRMNGLSIADMQWYCMLSPICQSIRSFICHFMNSVNTLILSSKKKNDYKLYLWACQPSAQWGWPAWEPQGVPGGYHSGSCSRWSGPGSCCTALCSPSSCYPCTRSHEWGRLKIWQKVNGNIQHYESGRC